MIAKETNLQNLIVAAQAGDSKALEELSLKALGGNKAAQAAIDGIDKSEWKTTDESSVVQAIIWPKDVKSGKRGPKQGDIPLHHI